MRLLVLVLLVALAALVVACGQANKPDEPSGDGIQVGAHWTVTVTDPDGTVARVHEFDNALDKTHGSALLASLLHGTHSVELHHIQVYRPSGDWYCAEVGNDKQVGSSSNTVPALATRDLAVTGTPVMLSGVCTVTDLDGLSHISKVASRFQLSDLSTFCYDAGVFLNTCFTTTYPLRLTSHQETIPVANNQIVAFNIVFSFE